MEELDEFRIKTLSMLRENGGRRMRLRHVVSTEQQLAWWQNMRRQGWVGFGARRNVRMTWITMEGRRALKCFERLYR